MKSITKLALLAGVAGMCFAAQPFAPMAVGGFTLPYQTSWGMAVLPAGHYTFRLEKNQYTSAHDLTIAISQGTKTIALIVTQAFDPASMSDRSSIQILNQRVRAFHLAPLGMTYYFPERKKEREFLAGTIHRPGNSFIPISAK